MNLKDLALRLKSYSKGHALHRGQRINTKVADDSDTLILAFVRMGGEGVPWGICYGRPHSNPNFLIVPDPRKQDRAAKMLATFFEAIGTHFYHPEFVGDFDPSSNLELRQVWMPNNSHLEMVHSLAFRYIYAKGRDPEIKEHLNCLGRLCSFLFKEAQMPGQSTVVLATKALKTNFHFPSDSIRQGHLGFLLAWMDTNSTYEKNFVKAKKAELSSVGTSLNPSLEKEVLLPLVTDYNNALKNEDSATCEKMEKQIESVIRSELESRFRLVKEARSILSSGQRKQNKGLEELDKLSLEHLKSDYLKAEQKRHDGLPFYSVSPETDEHPIIASLNYQTAVRASDSERDFLVDDDTEIFEELLSIGEAICGELHAVRIEKVGRKTLLFWEIRSPARQHLKFREGANIRVIGNRKIVGSILSVTDGEEDRIFTIEITENKKLAQLNYHQGHKISLVKNVLDFFWMKKKMLWAVKIPEHWKGKRTG